MNIQVDNDILYTDPFTMRSYPAFIVQAVDQMLMKVRHKTIWEICDFAIEFWMRKNPTESTKYLEAMKEHRSNRRDKFASTKDSILSRELVHLPSDVSYVLEKIAKHKIEDYGRMKFYKEFARRYPGFRGGEVL